MNEKRSYPEEIFELRLKKYKSKKRTKLPHQLEIEICQRVNQPAGSVISKVQYPTGFLAQQIEGFSQGRLPINLFDANVYYDEVSGTAAMKGPSGMVFLDDTTCKVDVARFFLDFIQQESCGECTFCRIGSKRMLEILNRICAGEGKPDDLETLEDLAEQVKNTSLCELGQSAANPVLSTLRYFRTEYEEHINDHICRAGACPNLNQTK